MKVLITGGAGFIGSHLAEALCEKGASVLVLDNLSTGTPDNLRWRRPNQDLELVVGDIRDRELIGKLTPGCDWIFHAAAIASVPASVAEPEMTNECNLSATLGLLIAARDAGVKRFLFASSSAIYGDGPEVNKSELDLPRPLTPYALQKYASERYCQIFSQLYGLPTVSFRYFNVFGPRQSFNSPYSGVIARFCAAILNRQQPKIFGDGLQSRDFVAVDNVVQANLLGAQLPAEQVGGKVYNVGTGSSISLLDLVGELNKLTGQNILPEFAPARAGDIRTSQADISEAIKNLGYEVRTSWQAGLRETFEFYSRANGETEITVG